MDERFPSLADIENVSWAILQALHKHVPEDKRPMSWSDMRSDQEERIRDAGMAAIHAIYPASNPQALTKDGEALTSIDALRQPAADEVEAVITQLEKLAQRGTTSLWTNGNAEVSKAAVMLRSFSRRPAADEVEELIKRIEMWADNLPSRDDPGTLRDAVTMLRSLSRQPSEEATRKAVEALKPFARLEDKP